MQNEAVPVELYVLNTSEISTFLLRKVKPSGVYRFIPYFNVEPLTEPLELFVRNSFCFLFGPWPLKTALFQPLVQKKKTVGIPVETFNPIISSSAEQKQSVIKGIQLELFLDHSSEAINSSAKIRIACRQINLSRPESAQHLFSAVQIACIVSASAPGYISACISAIRMVAAGLFKFAAGCCGTS